MDYRNLKPHPLANLFPKYGEEELLDLASDIAANGLHNPFRFVSRANFRWSEPSSSFT